MVTVYWLLFLQTLCSKPLPPVLRRPPVCEVVLLHLVLLGFLMGLSFSLRCLQTGLLFLFVELLASLPGTLYILRVATQGLVC